MTNHPFDANPAHETVGGHATWTGRATGLEVRFVGRGPEAERRRILAAVASPEPALAWVEQIHSARVLPARAGRCGRGDALVTTTAGLALAIATADCVPIVVGAGGRLAAAHAGWRGLAGRVIGAAVDALGDPQGLDAWIGPAIGPCCYEVGDEVARAVAEASDDSVVVDGPRERPHLDLRRAAEIQLVAAGLGRIRRFGPCTRCRPDLLWSYRGEGPAAGRNLAFAWLTGAQER